MNTSTLFSLKRFYYLVLNELKQNRKIIFIAFMTILLFFLILPFSPSASLATYPFFLYAGGFIITSRAFKDLHDPTRACSFLMLPCSNLEKFLSKWLLTSVIYAIGLLLICCVISVICGLIGVIFYHTSFYIFNIFQAGFPVVIGKYMIIQSIILLGAISFKQYPLIKTALALLILFFILSLFSLMISFFFCPTCLPGFLIVSASFHGLYFIFWLLAAPLCWYITYLKLAEYELR